MKTEEQYIGYRQQHPPPRKVRVFNQRQGKHGGMRCAQDSLLGNIISAYTIFRG